MSEFDSGFRCVHGVTTCDPCVDAWSKERRDITRQLAEARAEVEKAKESEAECYANYKRASAECAARAQAIESVRATWRREFADRYDSTWVSGSSAGQMDRAIANAMSAPSLDCIGNKCLAALRAAREAIEYSTDGEPGWNSKRDEALRLLDLAEGREP